MFLQRSTGGFAELYLQLTEDCRISFITTRQQEGMAACKRSMTLLLLKALYHQAGHEHIRRVGIHFSVSSGYYCTVDGDVTLDPGFFLIKWKPGIRELVAQKVPIDKNDQYGRCDRIVLALRDERQRKNCFITAGLLKSISMIWAVSKDYYYGYMIPDTSYLGSVFPAFCMRTDLYFRCHSGKIRRRFRPLSRRTKCSVFEKNRSNGERCSKFLP